jgi:hypothetical protein
MVSEVPAPRLAVQGAFGIAGRCSYPAAAPFDIVLEL